MITTTVSFIAAPGKYPDAVAYLHNIAKELKKATGVEPRVSAAWSGPAGHLLIASSYDSVKAWDDARGKMQKSNAIQKMIADAGKAGLFIPGSVTRAIWEQI